MSITNRILSIHDEETKLTLSTFINGKGEITIEIDDESDGSYNQDLEFIVSLNKESALELIKELTELVEHI